MTKNLLPEDTIVIRRPNPMGDDFPLNEYRKFVKHNLGKGFTDRFGSMGFNDWIASQAGRTLKEAAEEWQLQLEEHNLNPGPKTMEEILKERRFRIISDADKAFILAFDKAMAERGYDFGGTIGYGYGWGLFMIIYGKTGTKSRPVAARVLVNDDGGIYLRFFLSNVDKRREYIENTPPHIKNAFLFEGGDCTSCSTMCAPGKTYTIDGQLMQKCNHSTFYFHAPTQEKLPDYLDLLSKFYPPKKGR